MKKAKKLPNGSWIVNGKKYKHLIGKRAQVMHGVAYKTNPGAIKGKGGDSLTKKHLKYNKSGKIVSRVKSSKKNKLLKQLRDAGYTTKKGKFGAVKIGSKSTKKRKRGRRKGRKKKTRKGRKKKTHKR